MTNDMTQGKPLQLFLSFSIPLLIGNMFQQLYSMVDTIIVGKFLGEKALAGVGSAGSMVFLIGGFLIGLTSGFAVLVAQRFGAKDDAGVKKAIASNIILSGIFTVLTTLVMMQLVQPLLHMMKTPDDVFVYASDYITVIYAGIFTQVGYNMFAGILRALGDSKTPLYFLIISCILNIILDIVFILQLDMGVAGVAYATNVSQGISAILCLIYSYKKFDAFKLKKEDFNVPKDYYKMHICTGFPMALQFSITAIGIMTVQGAINSFGSTVVAAYTAASKVVQLVMQPVITYGVAVATYVGQNLGAGRIDRIKEGVKVITKVSVVTSVIAATILILFGKPLVGMFLENPRDEIFVYSQEVLLYAAIFYVPLGQIFVYRNALQAMGQSFMPMMAGFFELVARALAANTLPAFIGFTGICLSDPIAWLSASIPLFLYYQRYMKRLEIPQDVEATLSEETTNTMAETGQAI
ncbi:MAG: MATE family efflux transporter [Epulopiscium sp. Nele67-Bin005]|nr:MAG: MATE family efflux transporter [Epulopiscium sp. Nele67-Bin005]